ncbi:MAG TPA: hypothetical protein VGD56_08410 [Gemmatirosa sp.]
MTTGYAPDQPAQESAALPLDDIRTLVDERARYEGWLQALESRRAVTPTHVLERVRHDYAGRLDRVASQLAGHVAPLRAHGQALTQQHHAVEQRLGEERDGLAEIELRTLVGEFASDEGEQRRAGAAQAIAALERELGGAATALADVRGLVARVSPTPVATAATAPTGDVEAAAPSQVAADATAPATPSAGTPSARSEAPDAGFVSTGTFDHGAVDAARVALGDRQPSLTPTFTDAIRTGAPGSYGLGTRPPSPEPTAAAGQEKTLRCQDCGALNYPTEWYCEKCGGELAAL